MGEIYTERLLDHYRNPRNQGCLDVPDIVAEEYNPLCGDRVTIEARVEAGRIVEARFEGRGCALCLGAASILTELIQGRSFAVPCCHGWLSATLPTAKRNGPCWTADLRREQ
jgi:nitrogen fixation NifU-like protein